MLGFLELELRTRKVKGSNMSTAGMCVRLLCVCTCVPVCVCCVCACGVRVCTVCDEIVSMHYVCTSLVFKTA